MATKKSEKSETKSNNARVEMVNADQAVKFNDENMIRDGFLSKDVKFENEGDTFQGLILGVFTAEPKGDRKTASQGYNFLSLKGEKATVWGGAVLDKLLPQIEEQGTFVTITYTGKNKQTKLYNVTTSVNGTKKYANLLDNVDLDEFEWFTSVE